MDDIILRGTGRTTQQMLSAPIGAIYIWVNGWIGNYEYPNVLARSLGREDLQIKSPSWLEYGWRGLILTGIVVDHAAELENRQLEGWRDAYLRIK